MLTALNSSLFDFDNEPEVLFQQQFIWYHNWIGDVQAKDYYQRLLAEIPWKQESIIIAGKQIAVPRLECWMGDVNASYSYSGIQHHPVAWHPVVASIKERVEKELSTSFNSCLINYYRDENDSVSWHSDNEAELGDEPTIASVSFGTARTFQIKHNQTKKRYQFELQHGDLLVMQKASQHQWQHCLPKLKSSCGGRINLTFRHIYIES